MSGVSSVKYVFEPPPITSIPVANPGASSDPQQYFPVNRIYCVGRNYAEHAREMGGDPTRDLPIFFSKPRDSIVVACGSPEATAAKVKYPPATQNLHYEVEFVIALGKGGSDISAAVALQHVYGYAVGIDLTRRDLQHQAKEKGSPWDAAKGFDQSAPISFILPVQNGTTPNEPSAEERDDSIIFLPSASSESPAFAVKTEDVVISCTVNGEIRQNAKLSEMTWSIPEIISILSQQYTLQPGDLIFTGTPAGVGPIVPGDTVRGDCTVMAGAGTSQTSAIPSVKLELVQKS